MSEELEKLRHKQYVAERKLSAAKPETGAGNRHSHL